MRLLALAAAASMSLAPTLSMAQSCPENSTLKDGVCVCAEGFALNAVGLCVPPGPDVVVAVDAGAVAPGPLPILSSIPPGAIIVGGLVILAGVIIGIAAASGGTANTTFTTPTTTP